MLSSDFMWSNDAIKVGVGVKLRLTLPVSLGVVLVSRIWLWDIMCFLIPDQKPHDILIPNVVGFD